MLQLSASNHGYSYLNHVPRGASAIPIPALLSLVLLPDAPVKTKVSIFQVQRLPRRLSLVFLGAYFDTLSLQRCSKAL